MCRIIDNFIASRLSFLKPDLTTIHAPKIACWTNCLFGLTKIFFNFELFHNDCKKKKNIVK